MSCPGGSPQVSSITRFHRNHKISTEISAESAQDFSILHSIGFRGFCKIYRVIARFTEILNSEISRYQL